MKNILSLSILLLLLGEPAFGHGLRYQVSRSETVIVKVVYHNDKPFAGEQYDVFRPGETTPCFSGRTDGDGQIVFRPDSTGTWQIKTYSEDGHGLNISLETNGQEVFIPPEQPSSGRYSRVLLGLVIILGLFNLYALFTRRKRPLSSTS